MTRAPRFLAPLQQGLLVPASPALVIRAQEPTGLSELGEVSVEQGFTPARQLLTDAGFDATPRASGRFAMVVVNLTRSKAENLGNIARACQMSEGVVLVNGAKTDGIESLLAAVKKVTPVEVISKAHGKVFWFAATPMPGAWLAAAEPAKNSAGFFTAPGMFSPEKVDAGSALLAPHLAGLKGRVADLGAGWGWLAAQAMGPDISEMLLVEAEHMALEAARKNLQDPRATFLWADALDLPKMAPFDTVISNPPFHQGRAAQPEIGAGFIKSAAQLLKPKGRFLMVANRQLPYERALEAHFKKWTMCAQASGFKVFEASLPKR